MRMTDLLATSFAVTILAAPLGAQTLTTEQDKTFYALGLSIGKSLDVFAMTPAELELLKAGLADMVTKQKPKVELATYGPKFQQLAQSRSAIRAEAEKQRSVEFLARAAAEKGAVRLPSGLVYLEVTVGTGAMPTTTDQVKLNYRGTLADGTEFDSSYKRGQPAVFTLSSVVACFSEGISRMKVGGKARLVCPSSLGYGDGGAPPDIPGGAALHFEIELLAVLAR